MPSGVTKKMFKSFIKYYDPEIFVAAGRRIRTTVLSADELSPTERVKKIAQLFACFKNPDKETVLTPWRVVNMHMSDCLGGYDFYDEAHEQMVDKPRFVDRGKVTADTFANAGARVLEINSKTGLYPLYVTYSIFRSRCAASSEEELDDAKLQQLWDAAVRENVFVICKTPMAKQITRRTLAGYRDIPVNAHYFDDLINMMKNKPRQFVDRVLKPSYWKQEGVKAMKFDAVVGNPPYQLSGGSGGTNDAPIYQYFVSSAQRLQADYTSLIIPSRWFSGGRENLLAEFRHDMLKNGGIEKMFVFPDSHEIFSSVEIKGGLCYFLSEKGYSGECEYTLVKNGTPTTIMRNLSDFDVLIREPMLANIVKKVMADNPRTVSEIISGDTPFGIPTNPKTSTKNRFNVENTKTEKCGTELLYLEKSVRVIGYVDGSLIKKNAQDISKAKVCIPKAGGSGNDPYVLGAPIYLPQNSVCSQTFLYAPFENEEQAYNFITYLKTKFFRVLVSAVKISQDAMSKTYRFVPMQDFSKPWTDAELYEKYALTKEEIAFIESMIKPME